MDAGSRLVTLQTFLTIVFLLGVMPAAMAFPIIFVFTAHIVPIETEEMKDNRQQSKKKTVRFTESEDNDYDYWDGEGDLDYATGEISANTGPTIRHPKNGDRAYVGSP